MKYAILHPAALLLPLALLTGCARTPDMTPVWQETLPGSGAKATLSNCTLQDEREVDYIYSREDQDWKTRPALFTTASPVLTLTGVTADQVELRFSEEIADLYLGYDRVMPQPADGVLQYQLDTVYNYEFIITTETGTDDFLVICEQE